MRIAVLPSLLAPVREGSCFGGAEMAALALAEELAARSHDVTLIGLPGSFAEGCRLLEAPRATLIFRPGEEAALGEEAEGVFEPIFAALPELDVFHLHLLDPDALVLADRYARAHPRTRVVATLHLAALFPRTVEVVSRLLSEGSPFIFTAPSRFAAQSWAAGVRVYANGVPVQEIRFFAEPPPAPRLAWAGRRSREKGLAEAAQIARLAKMPLVIAGAEAPEGSVEVDGVEDLGALPRAEVARRVFGPASAVLVTSAIPESFSLVAAEALASGTPVIAFDRGALSEVIDSGKTGFLVPFSDVGAAADAVKKVVQGAISRQKCREVAVARFDHHEAVDRFVELYRFG
jgi:glycosyltransferase involved in cell wall biosynthesis